jgi:hypothetical protein
VQPDGIIRFDRQLSSDELDILAERWRQAYQRHRGRPYVFPSLPRRVRVRLWLEGRVNAVAIRLVYRDHSGAAVALWRVCRMWH